MSSSHQDANLDGSRDLEEFSGQTTRERRRLRVRLVAMKTKIVEHTEAMQDASQPEIFHKVRSENNSLFEEVRYRRELKLESENFELISDRAARQIDTLIQIPKYDPIRLTIKLREKCATHHGSRTRFDWKFLGYHASTCYTSVPPRVSFLYGPLQAGYQPRQRKRRLQVEVTEEPGEGEQPDNVRQAEKNADQLSAVERSVQAIHVTLDHSCRDAKRHKMRELNKLPQDKQRTAKKRLRKEGADCVDAVEFLFDPMSFTQTVENFCHFSFLIQQGKAEIKLQEDKPVVKKVSKRRRSEPPPARQAIVSMTLQSYRELCEAHSLTQGHIPHRLGSRFEDSSVQHKIQQDEESLSSEDTGSGDDKEKDAMVEHPTSEVPCASPTPEGVLLDVSAVSQESPAVVTPPRDVDQQLASVPLPVPYHDDGAPLTGDKFDNPGEENVAVVSQGYHAECPIVSTHPVPIAPMRLEDEFSIVPFEEQVPDVQHKSSVLSSMSKWFTSLSPKELTSRTYHKRKGPSPPVRVQVMDKEEDTGHVLGDESPPGGWKQMGQVATVAAISLFCLVLPFMTN